MSKGGPLPFPLGQTYFGGSNIDAAGAAGILGNEYVVSDKEFGLQSTGRDVTVRIVRNTAQQASVGVALLPNLGVHYDTAQLYGTSVSNGNGIALQNAQSYLPSSPVGIVDPLLGAAGVLYGDIFYIVVQGPVLCKSAQTVSANIAVGDLVQAFSAATTAATTAAGRFTSIQALTQGATTPSEALVALWGRAMSACTTSETQTLKLIDLRRTFG